ncbi:MAG: hypothetical protein IH790_06740 [Acidobacteria bacterium]|nr:hypothetical protein [Acidobacteriota bacterium]
MIKVMLLVLLLVPAWSFAQDDEGTKEPSLAELARKERERRAQLEEVPLITNANIKRLGGGRVSTAAGPEAETAATEGEEGAEAKRIVLRRRKQIQRFGKDALVKRGST